MGLEDLSEGQTAVIARIRGSGACRSQLLGLGLVPGVPIRAVQVPREGALVLEVFGSNLVLGRCMAENVEIRR